MTDKDCPICKGAGFTRKDVPIDHPDFGKAIRCSCNPPNVIPGMIKWSGLEGVGWTFDTFPGDDDAKDAALQAYRERAGIWVFHSITKGTGKTGLLVAVVNRAWQDGIEALYQSVPDLLDRLRQSYKDDSFEDLIEDIQTVPILALDEFHRWYDKSGGDNQEGSSSWAAEKIFRIIDYRYLHWRELLTLVATNLDLDKASPLDPIVSRFGDTLRSHKIKISGRDLRPLARQVER